MSDDIDRLIVQQKLQQPVTSPEYMVDGSAIGEDGWIPCIISGVHQDSDKSCMIRISDGYRTGEVVEVDTDRIVSFGDDFVQDAARRLFK